MFVLILGLSLEKNALVSAVGGVLTAFGGTYLLAVMTANLGRAKQDQLWRSWGGTPTAQLLRVHSDVSNLSQRMIWRDAIQVVTGVRLLPQADELADQSKADEVATAAVGQVRRLTHDDHYPLVAKENAQYGLERNLYGVRWLARLLSLACFVALGVAALVLHYSTLTLILGLIVEAALSVLWFIIPSADRTKKAAFRYSEQLLQAVAIESKGGKA